MSPSSDSSATASSSDSPVVDPEKGLKEEKQDDEQAVAAMAKKQAKLRRWFCNYGLVHYTALYTFIAVLVYKDKSIKELRDEWRSLLAFALVVVATFGVLLKTRKWYINLGLKQPSQESGSDDLSAKLLPQSEKEEAS